MSGRKALAGQAVGFSADRPSAPASTSQLGRVARGSTINLAGAAVSATATLGLTLAVTRMASKSDAGVFFSATSLFLLATTLGQLGTNTGLVYFLSGARARGELSHAGAYMRVAARPVAVVAIAMAAGVYLAADPLARVLSAGHEQQYARYLQVLALFIPCAAMLNLAVSGTRGLGTMRINALVDQISRPLLQGVLVLVVLVWSGPQMLGWPWGVPYVLLAAVAWACWAGLRAKTGGREAAGDIRPGRAFWRFSGPRALASVAQLAMQRFDVVLVGAIAGMPAAAVYMAATRFVALGQMAGGAVSQSLQPHLGETLARNDRAAAAQLYQVSTAWLVTLTWPLYLLIIGFAGTILTVFGGTYSGGTNVLVILCSCMLVATGCGMVDVVLNMAGRTHWNLMNVCIAFGLNLGLDLWLIPRMGITGAAIGWSVAILAANVIPLSQVALGLRLHPFGAGSLTAMALSMTCFAVVPFLARTLVGPGWSGLVLGGMAGLVLYLFGVWRARHILRLAELVKLRRRDRRPR